MVKKRIHRYQWYTKYTQVTSKDLTKDKSGKGMSNANTK